MTPVRWLIVLFWVFVIFMLLKGCYESQASHLQPAQAPPAPSVAPAPTPAAPSGAKVVQSGFVVQYETPPGNFTCQVTVKNIGDEKAVGVQVHVRPYRGCRRGLLDIGPQGPPLSENDPLSQLGAWVSFPDLAPGESSTQPVTFMSQSNVQPGQNPDPEIDYKSVPVK
jgi:hypothetical protein